MRHIAIPILACWLLAPWACSFDATGLAPPGGELCANNADDDGDGLIDCADPDCTVDPLCAPGAEICNNNIDDDGDGAIDCADPDCTVSPLCAPTNEICNNHVDDDHDGAIDCADSDCASYAGCTTPDEICNNHVDDDHDGATDCDDSDCANDPNCIIQPNEICDNKVDDDSDGAIDCDQSSCLGTAACGPCNPLTDEGCTNETCYLAYSESLFGTCTSDTGGGGQWSHCDYQNDCQPGYFCELTYTNNCVEICRPWASNDCPSYLSCHAFTDSGSDSPWGICY